ncbi:MAG: hypothetical protein KDB61_04100, partial [Planctomycetes bacterium]|nr:hypothetical protein [Planctomycetota bacterium]
MKSKLLLLSIALSAPAFGQAAIEEFTAANTDNWGLDFVTPATWNSTGGNPGGMIQVSVSSSTSSLPAPMLVPGNLSHPWRGDFKAMHVESFSYDREVLSGIANFGTHLTLVLADDNGTPHDVSDDAMVFSEIGDNLPWGSDPWTSFTKPIPAQEFFIPSGWSGEAFPNSPLLGNTESYLWDVIIQDVDYVGIATGRPWNGGAWFGQHVINFDNLRLDVG